jgi:hypothetical protein
VTGFPTRVSRTATRAPRVDQQPSSVPIHQTAPFAVADAEEPRAIAASGA